MEYPAMREWFQLYHLLLTPFTLLIAKRVDTTNAKLLYRYLKATIIISLGLLGCDLANGHRKVKCFRNTPLDLSGNQQRDEAWLADGWSRQGSFNIRNSHCPDANGNNTPENGCVIFVIAPLLSRSLLLMLQSKLTVRNLDYRAQYRSHYCEASW